MMKTLRKITIALISLILVVSVAGYIIITRVGNSGIPQYSGELIIDGLISGVNVIRDERGMPHIYAENEHDLYTVTGYIMAQERLWQMDLIRRATTGRLSEIFGEDYVETDLFLRTLKMSEKSRDVIENSDPEVLDCVTWFVEGVNRYIGDAGKNLPPEFKILGYEPEEWTMVHTINIIGYMGWDLAGGNLSGDIFLYRLFTEMGEERATALVPYLEYTDTPVYPGFSLTESQLETVASVSRAESQLQALGVTPFCGSNNWVVSGEKSTTGKPLFSNDMHLGLSSPGIWIQMHQVIPGSLNVTGVLVPGEPFVVAGHNDNIAWGMTNLTVDDIDLFAETINPDNSNQYLFNGEWKDMEVRNEEIAVKKGETQSFPVRFTHRGPIISGFRDVNDVELSMRWSGYDPSNEITGVYLLNRASDWESFKEGIDEFRSVSQNFAYADINGNIGLHVGGGIPVRKGYGTMIRPGDTDEYDWKGYLEQDQLPFSYNPPEGTVSSANNKTTDDNYPYYIGAYFSIPYRINRIRQMLGEQEIFSVDDFKRMITDRHSDYARRLVPLLLECIDKSEEMNETEQMVLAELGKWDYDMNPDLITPTFFEYFKKNLAENLLKDDIGELYNQIYGTVRDYYLYRLMTEKRELFVDDVKTPEVEDLASIMRISYSATIAEMEAVYGDVSAWKWGDIHGFTAAHPLSSVKILDRLFSLNSDLYRVGGSNHTVSPYSYSGNFVVNHGASERHIFNTADWDESYTVIPTGISGVPGSQFYLSQTETYCTDGFYREPFSREAVESAARYRMLFKSK